MANKRYDQFPAGTYDTSKIFLQADATTGALEKVNLPATGASNLIHLADVTQANNSGVNPQTMATIVIPANTLSTDGDAVEIFMLAQYLTAVGTKTMRVNFAAQNIALRTNTAAGVLRYMINLIRTSATTLEVVTLITSALTNSNLNGPTGFTFNPAIANNITVDITAGIANDITYFFTSVNVFKV